MVTSVTSTVVGVAKDVEVIVKCDVRGGDPAVSSVTLTCGGSEVTTTGTRAISTVRVTEGAESVVCSCQANHVTRCYDLTNTVTVVASQRE